MHPSLHHTLRLLLLILVPVLVMTPAATAQENPPPKAVDLPCATNVSAQVLGTTPVNDGAQNVVLARIIIGPGGSVAEHTHPGTVVFTVESGVLGFTHLGDMDMSVTRAATAGTEAVVEPLPHGEEVALNPGDTYVESGMVHTASNLSDGDTTVLMSGLMEAGQPLTVCVEQAATPAH
jgi:hypothetical protein